MGGLCCCDRHRAELEEELIDGGNELDSIARKEGFVLIKEPGTGAGTSWPKQYLQASGALLHFFKDATLKHLKTSVDLRQIAVAQEGADADDARQQIITLTATGQELLRFRAVEANETKEWLECLEEMQLDAQSSDALYQPAASPSSRARAVGASPGQGDGKTVVIGTDSITECDYNEL